MRLIALIGVLCVATPLAAQNGVPSPRGWSVAVFGGGAAFSDFQRSTIQAFGPSPEGGFERREFPRRIGAKTSGALAAAISYWPTSHWGFRLFGTYAPSRFQTIISESDAEFLDVPRSSEETGALAGLTITSYDAQALVRLPTIRHRVMPYVFAGVGIVRYETSGGDVMPEEAMSDFASGTRVEPALRVGIGAVLPMRWSGLGLNFELHNQISRTPLYGAGDRTVTVTNSLGFMVGMRLAL